MNISICITVFNEEGSIGPLLDSLIAQTQKPSEIVIVDGGSADKTVEIINHYQKRFGGIKLLKEKCPRAKGRNLSVEMARNEIIAMTDAGCVAQKDWLEKITAPFVVEEVDIAAGFYKMTGGTPVQKAMAVYLGTTLSKFDMTFLPSTRSVAFRKQVWEEVGGFPDEEKNSAEDTYFNYSALKLGMKYARVKSAVVEWGMPETIMEFYQKIRSYAMWDARTKIFVFPKKGLASHNIKALSVLLRYVFGFLLVVFFFSNPALPYLLVILLLLYFTWAYRKAGFWGIVLQIVSDLGVISGFISGIIG